MEESVNKQIAKYLENPDAIKRMCDALRKNNRTLNLRLLRGEVKIWIKDIRCFDESTLKRIIDRFELKKEPRNFYISNALLMSIPDITWNLKGRKDTFEYQDFENNYYKHMIGYDLFFDMDGHDDFALCYEETKRLIGYLEFLELPFYIIPSSLNGFQIIVPDRFLPKSLTIKEKREILIDIITDIKKRLNLSCLDINIMDDKKLRKLPFSPTTDGVVCIPLSKREFMNFDREKIKIDYVLKNDLLKGTIIFK